MQFECIFCLLFILLTVTGIQCNRNRIPDKNDNRRMHTHAMKRNKRLANGNQQAEENSSDFWHQHAQLALNERLQYQMNKNIAKNVIMFVGDGMSIATIAATRAYMGQQAGKTGEESVLSFEELPHTGMSKTYCVNSQVADSACSATAYLCGVKANIGTIGVNGNVVHGDWKQGINASHHVTSIAYWSQLRNKSTGFVTTTRVTHASPAGLYASTANRDWESDFDVVNEEVDPAQVPDIAKQLVRGRIGSSFNVILGCGREKFLPVDVWDEEGDNGERLDGLNLIEEWLSTKTLFKSEYVWHRDQLMNISRDTEYVMGLFESSHCNYNVDKTNADPSLEEMTEAAIHILSKRPGGFFLFVEGGRIDHAHHVNQALRALDETVQFSNAVRRAREMTNANDTLIVVTSDHGHTMSLSGYADRGNDILAHAGTADDARPYATLTYANGPGYRKEDGEGRHDVSKDNTHDANYKFPALAPLEDETHGGEDVAIFAIGPWAHLFAGVMEQNVIPYLMAYASCVGDFETSCEGRTYY